MNEKALNSMEGIHATVTLNPPVATVEPSVVHRRVSDVKKRYEELTRK